MFRNSTPPPPLVSAATSTETVVLPVPAKIYYSKSIQTNPLDFADMATSSTLSGSEPHPDAVSVVRENAQEMRARIIAELQLEREALDVAIAEERRAADEALASQQTQGLSAPALVDLVTSAPFLEFLDKSSKVVQRALADPYDYMRDYTLSTSEDPGQQGGDKVSLLGSWYDESWGRGRSVTAIDWSHKVIPFLIRPDRALLIIVTPLSFLSSLSPRTTRIPWQ